MNIPSSVLNFWNAFATATGEADTRRFYESSAFGDSEALANELAELVLSGVKRATAGAFWAYVAEGKRLPVAGDLSIITDWAGQPLCVIETESVSLVPFIEVSAEFAAAEGEGDGSLEYWRKGHRAYFTRECERAGKKFEESMLISCERFKVVYRAVAPGAA